jgi:D-glycero-alpha-D-manno-heptose 1-phosphate guanylyltransferase
MMSDNFMHTKNELAKVDVVILCGGLGTRLRPVSKDLPKVLMPFAGRPFIDILIESLLPFGFSRFVLCVGHLKEKVQEHFQNIDYEVIFSEETEPLGTGGALKKALSLIGCPSFLVINGDSICPVDFSQFYTFHLQKRGILSLTLVKPQSGKDYGVVAVDDNERVISFREKKECYQNTFINAGIYFMKQDIMNHMPMEARFSLEHDLFPKVLAAGCYGFRTNSEVIDIGTPERYLQALQRLSSSNSKVKLY